MSILNEYRVELADYLTQKLRGITGIYPFEENSDICHVFYVYPFTFRESEFGVSRKKFVEAMKAEGFSLSEGYTKPTYLLNFFQDESTYKYWPRLRKELYKKGCCPIAERMYEKELLFAAICRDPLTKRQIDLFVESLNKIARLKEYLK